MSDQKFQFSALSILNQNYTVFILDQRSENNEHSAIRFSIQVTHCCAYLHQSIAMRMTRERTDKWFVSTVR